MRRPKKGELVSYFRDSTEIPKVHLKENWRSTDPSYVEASVRACLDRLREREGQKKVSVDAMYEAAKARYHVDIEPTWRDWKAVPSGSKWQFLRIEADKTPQDTHIVMGRQMFRELPYQDQDLEFFNLPKRLQVGQVGKIWGRILHVDPRSTPNKVRFLDADGRVFKIVNLEKQSVWEET